LAKEREREEMGNAKREEEIEKTQKRKVLKIQSCQERTRQKGHGVFREKRFVERDL
jgi:hypothetical protein